MVFSLLVLSFYCKMFNTCVGLFIFFEREGRLGNGAYPLEPQTEIKNVLVIQHLKQILRILC